MAALEGAPFVQFAFPLSNQPFYNGNTLWSSEPSLSLHRPTEDPTSASPSLASTSSEALQYHSAVYRKPHTEEQARRDEESEYFRTLFWGDVPTRRAREEQFEQEHHLKVL
jgi:hypothetical protein